MLRFLAMLTLIAALAGCASSGQPISQGAVSQTQEGVTTREDLIRAFGPVMHTARDTYGRTLLGWGYSRFGVSEGLAVVISDEGKAIGYGLRREHPSRQL